MLLWKQHDGGSFAAFEKQYLVYLQKRGIRINNTL
jgi:hypothetical protein